MRRNTDSSFVGLGGIKRANREQVAVFEERAASGDWEYVHSHHYDWWVFPVNRRSSYGPMYVVNEGDVHELKQDAGFTRGYVRGVQLVAAPWGWDLLAGLYVRDPRPGQAWHDWPVRLYKAGQSVQLFGFDDLFTSLQAYALDLMSQGWRLTYGGKALSWLFTTGVDPYSSGLRPRDVGSSTSTASWD